MVPRAQKRSVRLRLPFADVRTATEALARPRDGSRLRIEVHKDGRFRARLPWDNGSRYGASSGGTALKGRVVADQSGVFLEGVIHERWTAIFVWWMFALVALVFAALCLILVFNGLFLNPGLYICGILAVLFGVPIWAPSSRAFPEADRLLDQLEQEVRARPSYPHT